MLFDFFSVNTGYTDYCYILFDRHRIRTISYTSAGELLYPPTEFKSCFLQLFQNKYNLASFTFPSCRFTTVVAGGEEKNRKN
jgi:hypothetical protein